MIRPTKSFSLSTNKKILVFICIFFSCTLFSQNKNTAVKIETSLFNNLYKLNDSLYRSEQPDSLDKELLQQLGIKSILNLRRYHIDEDFLGKNHFSLYHVKMFAFCITNKKIADAMQVIVSAPKPLLIHCKHGSDRTGAVIAMYRILFGNWTKQEALDELKNRQFGFHRIFINIPCYIKKVKLEKVRR